MKIKLIGVYVLALFTLAALYSCSDNPDTLTGSLQKKSPAVQPTDVSVSVFATGLNNPRGLEFGPDGYLYVAEGGLGGTNSTAGLCDSVIAPIGPYTGGYTASISKISPTGDVSIVADGLPSDQTSAQTGSLVSGVADVAFVGNTLYALLAGAGCSHGIEDTPNGIIKVNNDGTWTMIADLSDFQHNHPVKNPEPDDFEPDGTWYSMINVRGDLYAVEPNHGEIDKITTSGNISRVVDVSASQGHIVPTAIAYHGNFYFGNLHTFPIEPGSSNIYKVTPSGNIQIRETGLTTVVGLVFDNHDRMYALEMSTAPGNPTPGTGKIVRIQPSGAQQTLVDTLFFPTGMTMGPDGALYVSNKGFGPAIPGFGEILKINVN